MWWKKHKRKVIIPALVAAVLVGAYYFGGNAPGARGWTIATASSSEQAEDSVSDATEASTGTPEVSSSDAPESQNASTSPPPDTSESTAEPTQSTEQADNAEPPSTLLEQTDDVEAASPSPEAASTPTMEIDPETGKDQYLTDPVPDGKPLPVEPQDVTISDTAYTCNISISCATILDNMDLCDPEKVELVPEDGWILEPTTVTFYEGESVFNVLQRTCKQQGIHMEYENTPIYNSAYIEGINNLYEFDVGELSGWMYEVNDWFPNYGCSRYQLEDGDVIEWVYTCDLGYDLGGGYAVGG